VVVKRVVVVFVVVVVVVVAVVVVFFFLFLLFLVVVVVSVVVVLGVVVVLVSLSAFSLGRGGIPSSGSGGIPRTPPPPFSTQHLMLGVGQSTFSRTWSQIREAMAWMHLPGQLSTVAVLVTDPRKPDRKLLNPPWGLGLGLEGGGSLSSTSMAWAAAQRQNTQNNIRDVIVSLALNSL